MSTECHYDKLSLEKKFSTNHIFDFHLAAPVQFFRTKMNVLNTKICGPSAPRDKIDSDDYLYLIGSDGSRPAIRLTRTIIFISCVDIHLII
jgi:hypothetical protein